MDEELKKHTEEENLANLEAYTQELIKEISGTFPEVAYMLLGTQSAGEGIDRILVLVKFVLTYYIERSLKQDIPGMDPDYFAEQVHRLNQARDALVRAKDARDIHETT